MGPSNESPLFSSWWGSPVRPHSAPSFGHQLTTPMALGWDLNHSSSTMFPSSSLLSSSSAHLLSSSSYSPPSSQPLNTMSSSSSLWSLLDGDHKPMYSSLLGSTSSPSPPPPSDFEFGPMTLLLSIFLTILILITIIGNVFVIVAICVERNLRNVGNYLVFSLAIADLMVACLVMPIGAMAVVAGKWTFGGTLCDLWTCMDVLSCTASILHLVAIALDRYWAVTNVDYSHSRSEKSIGMLIGSVWTMAVVISVPPALGWKDEHFETRITQEQKCMISQDVSYQILATCATFYGPLIVILILYWNIFKVARKRIRYKPGSRLTSSSTNLASKDKNGKETKQKKKGKKKVTKQKGIGTPAPNPERVQPSPNCDPMEEVPSTRPPSSDIPQLEVGSSNESASANTHLQQKGMNTGMDSGDEGIDRTMSHESLNGSSVTAYTMAETPACRRKVVTIQETSPTSASNSIITETTSPPPISGHHLSSSSPTILDSPHGKGILKKPEHSSSSNESRAMEEIVRDEEGEGDVEEDAEIEVEVEVVEVISDPKRGLLHRLWTKTKSYGTKGENEEEDNEPSTSTCTMESQMNQMISNRESMEAKRERKAAKTLVIITGAFVVCWLPFFIIALIMPICGASCSLPDEVFALFLWLGYMNSMINPIIYTIFSTDFRTAFKKILMGNRRSQHHETRGGGIPHAGKGKRKKGPPLPVGARTQEMKGTTVESGTVGTNV